MSYTLLENQPTNDNGKCRYIFSTYYLGKRYRKHVTCYKSVVQTLYREWDKAVTSGISGKQIKLFELFKMYMKYITGMLPDSSLRHTVRSIELFRKCFNDMHVEDFKRHHIEDYTKWRRDYRIKPGTTGTISNSCINREIAELSKILTWAIARNYYTKNNPCFNNKLKVDVRREFNLSAEQFDELLQKAKERGLIYTAVLIALLTGLRMTEIYTLSWADINLKQSLIRLKSKNTKSKSARTVAIHEYLHIHLTELRQLNPFAVTVFQDWKTINALIFNWRKLRATLSFKEVDGMQLHFHDLRHLFAQSLVDAGVAVDDVSIFLGHSGVGITQRFYVKGKGLDALSKVEKIGDIIPAFKKKDITNAG